MPPARETADSSESLWYKDAILYAIHVKTFADGNSDGIGDFKGLTAKLDYLESLGVSCLWLLPFYESPLRDDGYDIAHYERIDPRYGTMADFRECLAAAHARGLRVITELMINHTSDAHPWFQEARLAAAGSPARDFYVWSDEGDQTAGGGAQRDAADRSHWTWDRAAESYYRHRFDCHQPDLNVDNPRVRVALVDAMRFWLDLGVDGLRLDAVAHLHGGSVDGGAEAAHAFLRTIRADLEARYPGRILVADAHETAAEPRAYFGDGDESHMAFHFPLMARLFLALQQGDASPVADIVRRTRDLPGTCQWAVFLRSHDELTLQAIEEGERQALLDSYAAEPRMRLNRGIRRRLAPLLGNDRRRIELAYALLLSLPGSPVLYYGDEIGMGDNVHLGDRDGVRTPMQWTDDIHGGFARISVAHPVLPAIDDPVYGYRVVNVAAQQRDPASLLAAIRRLIRVRRRHPAFGRGAIDVLDCANRRILAFVRREGDEALLVVANLSDAPQPAMLDLPAAAGSRLIPLADDDGGDEAAWAPAEGGPCQVTLEPLTCQWFQIVSANAAPPVRPRVAV